MRRFLTIVVAVMTMGVFVVPAVGAGQEKMEVCHLEGTGEFHLISIADPAFDAHVAHGDGMPGGPVPVMPGFVFDENCLVTEAEVVVVTGEFDPPPPFGGSNPPDGSTVADERGLTYAIQGVPPFTDPDFVYAEALWGVYPLYLPGATVDGLVTVTNAGDTPTDPLTLVVTAFELNLDGSLGNSILHPPPRHPLGVVAPESSTQIRFIFSLPGGTKRLNVVRLDLYVGDPADGQLLTHLDMVFCPPELN